MLFKRWAENFSDDLAIDLGTANTLVFVRGEGIVLNEPSVVAIHEADRSIIAVGREAKAMLGRTPGNIRVIRPLKDGVIADFEITEKMLGNFISQTHRRYRTILRPRVVVGVPSGITQVERRAVRDAVMHAGARAVYLVEQPVAAAMGAGLPIQEPGGNLIVDILEVHLRAVALALGVHGGVDPALRAHRVRALHGHERDEIHGHLGLAELDDRHQAGEPAADDDDPPHLAASLRIVLFAAMLTHCSGRRAGRGRDVGAGAGFRGVPRRRAASGSALSPVAK